MSRVPRMQSETAQAPLDSRMSAKHKSRPSGKTTKNGSPHNVTRLRKVESLERLRERIQAAADEIIRLRTENARMSQNIGELQSAIKEVQAQPRLQYDGDAGDLKEKVRSFIRAIDEYLDHETA